MDATTQHKTGKVALMLAIGLGVVLGVVITWNPMREYVDVKASPTPLGVGRQQLLDSLSNVFTLEPVENRPALYVVKLGGSTATVAIQGNAAAPDKVNVTSTYTKDTAPVIATAANLLAKSMLGDGDWYGAWAGTAIHKCEPGFDIVGTRSDGPGVVEVRMSKREVDGEPVLSIAFRRLRQPTSLSITSTRCTTCRR